MHSGGGYSEQRDPRAASREAYEQALNGLQGRDPSIVFAFATAGYEQELLVKTMGELAGKTPLVGCSGEGVIAFDNANESNFALSMLALADEELSIDTGYVENVHEDARLAGRNLARAIDEHRREDTRVCLVFTEGMHIRLDGFMDALNDSLQAEVPVIGGVSGDNWQLADTYQYRNGQVHRDSVVWALLHGPFTLDWTLSHGCTAIGRPRTVTSAKDNRIYTIDDEPILDLLKEYLVAEQREDCPAVVNVALGLEAPPQFGGGDDPYEYVITHIAPTPDDYEAGCLTVPRDIPTGTKIWLVRRDDERIVAGNDRMVASLKARHGSDEPAALLYIDCASRGKACFREDRKVELLRRIRRDIGSSAPLVGFYSYGELCPIGNTNCAHHYTAVMTALYAQRGQP